MPKGKTKYDSKSIRRAGKIMGVCQECLLYEFDEELMVEDTDSLTTNVDTSYVLKCPDDGAECGCCFGCKCEG